MYSAIVGLLYKKWIFSFVESTYLVNLIVLGGAFLPQDRSPNVVLSPVPTTSVVVSLFIFICTVIIYTVKRIVSAKIIKFEGREIEEVKHDQTEKVKSDEVANQQTIEKCNLPTVQVVVLKDELNYDPTLLRETLLETATQ